MTPSAVNYGAVAAGYYLPGMGQLALVVLVIIKHRSPAHP